MWGSLPECDSGGGKRRWRALDIGRARVFVEAVAPLVKCKERGVVIERVSWAREGRDEKTMAAFFDELGPELIAMLAHVSVDAAAWIGTVVRERCPNAVLCIDPLHAVA